MTVDRGKLQAFVCRGIKRGQVHISRDMDLEALKWDRSIYRVIWTCPHFVPMGGVSGVSYIMSGTDPNSYAHFSVANVLLPCGQNATSGTCCPSGPGPGGCSLTSEGSLKVAPGGSTSLGVTVHHGLPGTLTFQTQGPGLTIQPLFVESCGCSSEPSRLFFND